MGEPSETGILGALRTVGTTLWLRLFCSRETSGKSGHSMQNLQRLLIVLGVFKFIFNQSSNDDHMHGLEFHWKFGQISLLNWWTILACWLKVTWEDLKVVWGSQWCVWPFCIEEAPTNSHTRLCCSLKTDIIWRGTEMMMLYISKSQVQTILSPEWEVMKTIIAASVYLLR